MYLKKKKIKIYQEETLQALKYLNKKKALGADNLSAKPLDYDAIFDVSLEGKTAIQICEE